MRRLQEIVDDESSFGVHILINNDISPIPTVDGRSLENSRRSFFIKLEEERMNSFSKSNSHAVVHRVIRCQRKAVESKHPQSQMVDHLSIAILSCNWTVKCIKLSGPKATAKGIFVGSAWEARGSVTSVPQSVVHSFDEVFSTDEHGRGIRIANRGVLGGDYTMQGKEIQNSKSIGP